MAGSAAVAVTVLRYGDPCLSIHLCGSSLSVTTVFRDCILVCRPFVGTSDSTDNFFVGSDQELSRDPVSNCDDS